jgi:dTDP-4-dehydrorhamnose 3,5-epimerase
MKISDTVLPGCKIVEPSPLRDDRGYFMRLFDAEVFAAHGMATHLAQASLSFNAARGTLRGLHFQAHPGMEDKLVRCGRGAVFDVAVDIRPGSPTFGRWIGLELSEAQGLQLYIPAGFAHGFQTLTDDAVVLYQISVPYEAPLSAGLRFDDPELGIAWPLPPLNLSPRDRMLPALKDLDRAGLTPFLAPPVLAPAR